MQVYASTLRRTEQAIDTIRRFYTNYSCHALEDHLQQTDPEVPMLYQIQQNCGHTYGGYRDLNFDKFTDENRYTMFGNRPITLRTEVDCHQVRLQRLNNFLYLLEHLHAEGVTI